MEAMQDYLQRKLNSTATVDDDFSLSKTRETNTFKAIFLPNSSTNSSGGRHHWIHGMNMKNSLQRKLNSTGMVDDNF